MAALALAFAGAGTGLCAAPALEWERTFGGAASENGTAFAQTPDGGYIIAGTTASFGAGDYDVWIIKTDQGGNELWNRTYGGVAADFARSIQNTSDGGYIVAGATRSYGAGHRDVWLIKIAADGVEQWDRTYGGADWDYGRSVRQTSDGGYIVAGYTASYGAGSDDVYLIKTDAAGNASWTRTFGGFYRDYGFYVKQTSDGGYVITGETDRTGAMDYDLWLIKTDAEGNRLWDRTFGGPGEDRGRAVEELPGSGFIIAGYTSSYGNGGADYWLIRTDALGNKLWDRTFGGPGEDLARSLVLTSDGGYLLTGFTESFGAGLYDIWAVKTDSNGNMQWDWTYGTPDYYETANMAEQTPDKGFIIVGEKHLAGSGNFDILLIKLGPSAPGNPVPDIKVNGSDAPVATSSGSPLTVNVSLDPGDRIGERADWWIRAETPFGLYSYNVSANQWVRGLSVSRQGPVGAMGPVTVMDTSALPAGAYTFRFDIDMSMDGVFNSGQSFGDSVNVTIRH
ncbi:MAG: hypothetical protein HY893_08065 [Deltaproteobacteria bacterium]|nr:hypothetical protein [Deltaproteobacteria bacterium]